MKKSAVAAIVTLVSAPALANDITATNCEVFVDKVQVLQSSHGHTTMNLFVKVAAERLDAPVKSVSVVHRRDEYRTEGQDASFDYRQDELPSFLGASDYFQFSSVTGHDWMTARELATFVVETTSGSRYWLNMGNHIGVNFAIDGGLVSSLVRRADGSYRQDGVGGAFNANVSTVPQTADYPQDLAALFNPRRCR